MREDRYRGRGGVIRGRQDSILHKKRNIISEQRNEKIAGNNKWSKKVAIKCECNESNQAVVSKVKSNKKTKKVKEYPLRDVRDEAV
jgi:hypothetical protein